jgi:hypothetical protein
MIGVELRPWTLIERIVCWLVMDGNREVAAIAKPFGEETSAATEARIIGAAPKLANLLSCALDEYEQHNGRKSDGPHWSVGARALLETIEKTGGRQ